MSSATFSNASILWNTISGVFLARLKPVASDKKKEISIRLKFDGKKSVIEGLKRVSKPGLRRFVGSTEIPRVRGGLGVAVLSTSEGLMTDAEARKKNLGGELLFFVW